MQLFKTVLFFLFCTPSFAQKQGNTVIYFDKNSNLLTIEARKTLSDWVLITMKTRHKKP
jgi:hypothetical protein